MSINGHILLVEDDADDEMLTLRGLNHGGVLNEVRVAHDGAEALEILFPPTGPADYPGLILLDLKLPKVDGFGVLARIRADERTRLIPVVILTSSKEQEDIASGYRSGANAYVRKPVKFSAFAEAVRTLGLFWLMVNEPPPLASTHRTAAADAAAAATISAPVHMPAPGRAAAVDAEAVVGFPQSLAASTGNRCESLSDGSPSVPQFRSGDQRLCGRGVRVSIMSI